MKTVFFLKYLNLDANYRIFEFLLALSALSLIIVAFKYRSRIIGGLAAVFFAIFGCLAVRNISLFGLAFLVTASLNFSVLSSFKFYGSIPGYGRLAAWWRRIPGRPIYAAIFLLLMTGASIYYFFSSPFGQNRLLKGEHGWGVAADSLGSAGFFLQTGLTGPIFNNYDIGSALTFWLSGREKVFVDNRPEAYSVSFFNDLYKPMQLEAAVWENARKKYGFQSIYFAYTDSTPWAQQFLARILADKDWSLVYFDAYAVILVPSDVASSRGLDKIEAEKFSSAWRRQAASASLEGKFNLASLAMLAGQPDLAAEIYQNILSRYPDNTYALISLSQYYAGRGDRDNLILSLDYADRAYRSGYRLPAFYDQEGMTYWLLGQPEQAVANWRRALKINKKDISALYYLNQVAGLEAAGKLSLPK